MDEGGEDDPNAIPSLLPLGRWCGNLRQRLILLLLTTSILIMTKASGHACKTE